MGGWSDGQCFNISVGEVNIRPLVSDWSLSKLSEPYEECAICNWGQSSRPALAKAGLLGGEIKEKKGKGDQNKGPDGIWGRFGFS